MDPATLAYLLISLGVNATAATVTATKAKKRGKEADKAIADAESEKAQAGANQAQRAIMEKKILGPIAGLQMDAREKGESLLAAANMSSGKDVAALNSDVLRQGTEARTQGALGIEGYLLNAEMEELQRIESKIAGLRASKLGYETDSTNAMLGLLASTSGDVATVAAANPEALTNLRASRQAFKDAGLPEELADKFEKAYSDNPEAFKEALRLLREGKETSGPDTTLDYNYTDEQMRALIGG